MDESDELYDASGQSEDFEPEVGDYEEQTYELMRNSQATTSAEFRLKLTLIQLIAPQRSSTSSLESSFLHIW